MDNGDVARTCFLLVEPRGLDNSGEIARRIAKYKGVKEVHLTTGRYGFVVSARTDSARDLEKLSASVKKTSRSRAMNVAVSHFVYR